MADSNPPSHPVPAAAGQSAHATLLPIGTRLQEFEVTGFVGEGGFSMVYEGFDTSLNRRVAIKEYMPSQLATRVGLKTVSVRSVQHRETFEAGLRSFINEARLLAQFKHPALVEVFRFWEENQTAYLVMPYYDGQPLKQFLTTNPGMADERWLRMLLAPLLDALGHMHAMNVYHRDIAPDNILVLRNGNPLLLDLGAARHIIADMTQALTVILKPGYAPIEQYADDASVLQGPWTDIYALSAVLYFAITGKAPTPSVTRMMRDPLIPLARAAGSSFSAEFLAAIDSGLSVRPEDRPQTIEAFREMLGVSTFSMSSPTVRQAGFDRSPNTRPASPNDAAGGVGLAATAAESKPTRSGAAAAPAAAAPAAPAAAAPAGSDPAGLAAAAQPAGSKTRYRLLAGGAVAVLVVGVGVAVTAMQMTSSPAPEERPAQPASNAATEPVAVSTATVEPAPAPAPAPATVSTPEPGKTAALSSPAGAAPGVGGTSAKAAPAASNPAKPRPVVEPASDKSTDNDRRAAAQPTTAAKPPDTATASPPPAAPPPPAAYPATAPAPASPATSGWHAALLEALRACGALNAFERMFCAERAKWKHCEPDHWGAVPECPATGTGAAKPFR